MKFPITPYDKESAKFLNLRTVRFSALEFSKQPVPRWTLREKRPIKRKIIPRKLDPPSAQSASHPTGIPRLGQVYTVVKQIL